MQSSPSRLGRLYAGTEAVPLVFSLAACVKSALDERWDEATAMEPELFLRTQSNGEGADNFLSARPGGADALFRCSLSRWEKLERNLPSYSICEQPNCERRAQIRTIDTLCAPNGPPRCGRFDIGTRDAK